MSASIVVVIALQTALGGRYRLHPWWLLTVLEVALLAVLTVINPVRMTRETRFGRHLSMSLAGLITLDNVASAIVLDRGILTGTSSNDALDCSAPAPPST